VYVSAQSLAPMLMRVTGGVFVLAGVATLFISADQARAMFDWLIAAGPAFNRAWGCAVAVLALTVAYATTRRPRGA
jgi:hypothetical protein